MPDMTNVITNTISISMFNRGLAGKVFDDVKKCGTKVVIKNNTPECVLLSPDEYVKIMDELNDARLLALANERMNGFDSSSIMTESDVMKELGINNNDLDDIDKVEIE